MTITLTGENDFAISKAEQQLILSFVQKHGRHGLEKVDGETFDHREFSGLLQGVSLFAPAKLVIIKDLAKNKAAWEALPEWLDVVPEETTLVIIEPAPDKRTKTYKQLKSKSDFKEFNFVEGSSLIAWSQDFAKNIGGDLGRLEAQNLINRAGLDQWRLSSEIEKLVNYNPKIDLKNIELLVEPSADGNAFELLDAAMSSNKIKVQSMINQLKTEEDPYRFFGLLASQVHALAVVSISGGKSADLIAKEAGLHPFVVRKSQSLALKLGADKIKNVAAQVAQCDRRLKSTGADPWDLLSLTLQKIAA
ncbi:MAG TPA: DNA polymerase III subunit delta [Candidatus Saccharimonadales bacterium]|nr:DNA polymerase III subunit delta [Candidatus Saccharimonadales bacterium]